MGPNRIPRRCEWPSAVTLMASNCLVTGQAACLPASLPLACHLPAPLRACLHAYLPRLPASFQPPGAVAVPAPAMPSLLQFQHCSKIHS